MDIVPSQKLGFLADDAESYTEALNDIFMMDEGRHREMQENARRHIETTFSEESFAADFIDVLLRV